MPFKMFGSQGTFKLENESERKIENSLIKFALFTRYGMDSASVCNRS